jgi:hypothetical protein
MGIVDGPATVTADDLPFDWRSTPLVRPDWKPSDLTPEQWDAYRQLTGEQRMRISSEMTDEMRRREFARIRAEHSDWIRLEVVREWIRLCFLPDPMPGWLAERFQEDIAAERGLAQN